MPEQPWKGGASGEVRGRAEGWAVSRFWLTSAPDSERIPTKLRDALKYPGQEWLLPPRKEPCVGDGANTSKSAKPALCPALWINVGLLLAVAAGSSLWLSYYTDRFPQIAGLLASGGALAWLGIVVSALLGQGGEVLKNWVQTELLNSTSLTLIFSLLAVTLLGLANFRGGLQLEPLQEPMEHSARIHGVGKPEGELFRVPAAGTLRWTGWTNWCSPAQVQVKVSGYPERTFIFEPWQRYQVYVPDSLVRPVVLLWPGSDLIDSVRDTTLTLQVVVKEGNQIVTTRSADFDGHAVWIGGASDLAIPDKLEQKWNGMSTKRLDFWLSPSAPTEFDMELQPGQEVQASLLILRKNATTGITTKEEHTKMIFKVKPLRTSHDFVQEEELNAPPAS
jgi:hypothetical protein